MWPDLRGAKALDLGCGIGLYSFELARRGAVAVGVDTNLEYLGKAQAQAGAARSFFVCADAQHLPFRDGVFDMAVSVEVLSHIPPQPRKRVFEGVERVLRNGGCAYYTFHNRWRLACSRWLRFQRPREVYQTSNLSVWPLDPAEISANLSDCGMPARPFVRYLNFHSRFSYSNHRPDTLGARLVVAMEEVMGRLPLLRRLAITFLIVADKAGSPGGDKKAGVD
jgi:SAM-dependent methyltransferase